MAKKVPCPKCGKMCGPTYLERHQASCKGHGGKTDESNAINTQQITDINQTRANLVTELLDVEEPELNTEDMGEDLDCVDETEEVTEVHQESSGLAVLGIIAFGVVVIIALGAFIIKGFKNEQ